MTMLIPSLRKNVEITVGGNIRGAVVTESDFVYDISDGALRIQGKINDSHCDLYVSLKGAVIKTGDGDYIVFSGYPEASGTENKFSVLPSEELFNALKSGSAFIEILKCLESIRQARLAHTA